MLFRATNIVTAVVGLMNYAHGSWPLKNKKKGQIKIVVYGDFAFSEVVRRGHSQIRSDTKAKIPAH
jgi:hypothetical protein